MTDEQYLRARGWSQGGITPSGWTPPGWDGFGDLSVEDAVQKQLNTDIAARAFVEAEIERRSLASTRAHVGQELELRDEGTEIVTRPMGPPRTRSSER